MSNFLRIERIREAVTKTAKLLLRGKVEVTQQGATPFVRFNRDGTIACVNLPMIPDMASSEFLDAVQGFIDHEVAHVLFTDKLAEIEVLNRGAEEGLPMDRIASMSNAFEDVRIERLMKLEYEGAAYNLTRSLAFVMGSAIKDGLTACDSLPPEQRSQSRAMTAMLVWIRARGGDHNAQLFIDENGLQPDFALLDELFPSMGERIAALETSADAAQLGVDFVRAIMPPSPPEEPSLGEGEGEDDSEGEEGEKRDNPSLGEVEDGTSDDSDDSDDDDEVEGDSGDQEDDGDGQGSGDDDDDGDDDDGDDSDDADDDGSGGDAETPDDGDDSDDDDGSGGDADDDGEEDGDDAEGSDGDIPEKPGKPDGEENPAEDKEDGEEKSGKKSKSRRVTEAMKSLNPYYRSLIADTMRKKQSVSDLSRKHSKPTEAIKDDLRNARRQFREAYKGV